MKTRTFFKKYILKIFIICFICFIAIMIGSYYVCTQNLDVAMQFSQNMADMIEEKGLVDDAGNVSLFKLFFNNLQAAGMGTILGLVPFFFLPALVILINGVISAAVLALTGTTGKSVMLMIVAGILPHGIFEIPAIVLGCSLGIAVCLFECEKILGRGKMSELNALEFFGHTAKTFILVCIPLLIIAALIETYVTMHILSMVL